MPDLLLRSFAPLLLAFQPCFTKPSFCSFWAVACAWILCSGRRSLTRIIQSAQLTKFKHYCSFHRFFSQARGTSMIWAIVSSNCCYRFVQGFWSAPSTTHWPVNPAATSGAPACTTIPCAPPRNDPSSPSAITLWSSLCKWPCLSRPKSTGPSPSWSACTANAKPASALPAKTENWSASRSARPPPSNIAPAPNWPWR